MATTESAVFLEVLMQSLTLDAVFGRTPPACGVKRCHSDAFGSSEYEHESLSSDAVQVDKEPGDAASEATPPCPYGATRDVAAVTKKAVRFTGLVLEAVFEQDSAIADSLFEHVATASIKDEKDVHGNEMYYTRRGLQYAKDRAGRRAKAHEMVVDGSVITCVMKRVTANRMSDNSASDDLNLEGHHHTSLRQLYQGALKDIITVRNRHLQALPADSTSLALRRQICTLAKVQRESMTNLFDERGMKFECVFTQQSNSALYDAQITNEWEEVNLRKIAAWGGCARVTDVLELEKLNTKFDRLLETLVQEDGRRREDVARLNAQQMARIGRIVTLGMGRGDWTSRPPTGSSPTRAEGKAPEQ